MYNRAIHDHMNYKCPILKQSRPVAHAVGYAVHGLGFYHTSHLPLVRTKKETKVAMISVVGGVLSKEQVIAASEDFSWKLGVGAH